MSTGLLSSGVLATEEGQRFLQIAECLIDRAFWGLYHRFEAEEDLAGCRQYRVGLERVPKWGDDIIVDDIRSTSKANPDFADLFQRMFRRFYEERHPHQPSFRGKVEPIAWLRAFYLNAASSPRVRSGSYFRNAEDIVSRRIQAADCMRSAFFAVLMTADQEVEITPDDSVSQVGGGRGEAPAHPPPQVMLQPSGTSRVSASAQRKEEKPPEVSRQASIDSIFQRHEA